MPKVLIILLLLLPVIYGCEQASDSDSGGKAYDFTLPDVDGNLRSLADFKGKIVVVNFWASWCSPCLREIPVFVKLQEKWHSSKVVFVGIAIDEREAAIKFARKLKVNYPILIGDEKGIEISAKLGNNKHSLPYTVIINSAGNILKTKLGEISENMLVNAVQPLLENN